MTKSNMRSAPLHEQLSCHLVGSDSGCIKQCALLSINQESALFRPGWFDKLSMGATACLDVQLHRLLADLNGAPIVTRSHF